MRRHWNGYDRAAKGRSVGDHIVTIVWLAVAVIGAVAVVAIVASFSSSARAHDWYPPACCSGDTVGGDCGPIKDARVKPEADGGYVVDGRFHVSREAVQPSMDGNFHGCFPNGEALRCFFAPERRF